MFSDKGYSGLKHLTEKVTVVAWLSRVRVVVDHAHKAHSTAKINKVRDLALIFWLVSLPHKDFIFCQKRKRFPTYFLLTHIMRCLSSMVNLIATILLLTSGLHRCIAASKEYLRTTQIILCYQNQHFISYFVWYFHSNWLLFLSVMQENQSGCFL